jgi:hypothetical protein
MELAGKVKLLFDTQEFASGFKKREFVVTTQEQYPQDVKFEAIKERIDMIDQLKVGDEVTVHFNIRGNEYQGKYFVNLQAWRIEKGAGTSASAAPTGTASSATPPAAPMPNAAPPAPEVGDEDDLPF